MFGVFKCTAKSGTGVSKFARHPRVSVSAVHTDLRGPVVDQPSASPPAHLGPCPEKVCLVLAFPVQDTFEAAKDAESSALWKERSVVLERETALLCVLGALCLSPDKGLLS